MKSFLSRNHFFSWRLLDAKTNVHVWIEGRVLGFHLLIGSITIRAVVLDKFPVDGPEHDDVGVDVVDKLLVDAIRNATMGYTRYEHGDEVSTSDAASTEALLAIGHLEQHEAERKDKTERNAQLDTRRRDLFWGGIPPVEDVFVVISEDSKSEPIQQLGKPRILLPMRLGQKEAVGGFDNFLPGFSVERKIRLRIFGSVLFNGGKLIEITREDHL